MSPHTQPTPQHRQPTPPHRHATIPVDARPHEPYVALCAQNVHVAYRKKAVVRGASLHVRTGEVHGLVGPNGAGKSTLLRALAALVPITAGTVLTEHPGSGPEDISRLTSRERARHIAFLPQDTHVDAGLTVEAVVGLGRYSHRGLLSRMHGDLTAEDRAIVTAALERVGASHLRERRIDHLSGGQRQLVLIAKQLAQQSLVQLLDEPVSALDLGLQSDVVDLMRSLAADGHAIGVVVHDLNLAARACDVLTLLADGVVLATGTPHEVLTPDLLSQAYGIDADIDTDPVTGTPRLTVRGRSKAGEAPLPGTSLL